MRTITLDPTFEGRVTDSVVAPRPATLRGATVALLDNSKKGGRDLLDRIEEGLLADHGVADTRRFRKPNLSAPAPSSMMDDVVRCDAVITAVGD